MAFVNEVPTGVVLGWQTIFLIDVNIVLNEAIFAHSALERKRNPKGLGERCCLKRGKRDKA